MCPGPEALNRPDSCSMKEAIGTAVKESSVCCQLSELLCCLFKDALRSETEMGDDNNNNNNNSVALVRK
jgi:hypothetical protein